MSFTHLHVHTEHSLLDGASRVKKLVARAKELGMKSIAITDHGVMFGVVDFWRECQKHEINGILGCEVYVSRKNMTIKEPENKRRDHLILLAKNNIGYKNIMKIVSRGFTEGFYYKPRVDKDVLRKYNEGIICLSACLAGEIPRHLLDGNYDKAKDTALEFIEIYGKENFFLEIQDHGLEEQYKILKDMKRLSEELDIPLVATNDVHYVDKKDSIAHDVLLCIQTGSTIDTENRMKFPNDEFYLKSEEEMLKTFSHTQEAVYNTQLIADRCKVDMEFGKLKLPDFHAPDETDNYDYLKKLCMAGLEKRYDEIDSKLLERLEYELSIIKQMGYIEYFLIVWDFINYAKNNKIPVGPGRGSAAGSLVSYTLGITDIDPIEHKLIFERFLNPERVSMPDIDIDFSDERRGEVIDYVIEKYGHDKVTQIITFGSMKAKAAVRDVARVLNVPYKKVDDIAKAIPNMLNITLEKALKISPEFKAIYDSDEEAKKVIDMAMAIEGMPRHASTHAAGVVITKESVDEYVPLYLGDKGVSTQFPMTTIEELGLLKMDFLGLRNLSVIENAKQMILENHGVKVDFSDRKYDDSKVFEMISSGNTQGIFQLESGGMTQFMKNLKPDRFDDIVAGISLYRPGPMASIPTYINNKKNPESIVYLHPKLKDILEVTYGILIYQEQVMQIVRDLAGYTYGRSDILRRAMGKKKMDVMLAEKDQFVSGCKENDIDEKTAEAIFDQMVTFAEYGFNKSHAVGYAVIGYETAYLKTYYTKEYMAALMSSVINDSVQVAKYIRNCKEMSIQLLPPDINKSKKGFSIDDGKIRFGLLGIKNVGEAVIDNLIKSREEKGAYRDIFDFVNRQDVSKLNKKSLLSLIKAGALDSLHENRASMIAVHESIIENAQKDRKNNIEGQMSLFDMGGENRKTFTEMKTLPHIKPLEKKDNIALEKEMTGVYITGHPLSDYEEKIKNITTADSDLIEKANEDIKSGIESVIKNDDSVIVSGLLLEKKKFFTKKNQLMAFLTIEDLYSTMDIVVFPQVYEKFLTDIEEDDILVIGGKISFQDNKEPSILANFIEKIENFNKQDKKYDNYYKFTDKIEDRTKVNKKLKEQAIKNKELSVDDILTSYVETKEEKLKKESVCCEDAKPLKIKISTEKGTVEDVLKLIADFKGNHPVYIYTEKGAMKAPDSFNVSCNENLIKILKDFLGEENIKF